MAESSSSNIAPHNTHEVFLSFSGKDTRSNFISHLHACLTRFKIKTYIDYNLVRGDEISNALLRAIEESKLSVVVLSENYANSNWCLDELVGILHCKENMGQVVVPVFYGIDPSSVRNLTGSYGIAFDKHERQFSRNEVETWKNALAYVADLAGWHEANYRTDAELVETIAMDVLKKLGYVNFGNIDEEIDYNEQLLIHQRMHLNQGCDYDIWHEIQATEQHLAWLRMKKNDILLGPQRGV